MEQRDYSLRQIKQLGQVLALMLERLFNLKQPHRGGFSLEEIKQSETGIIGVDNSTG